MWMQWIAMVDMNEEPTDNKQWIKIYNQIYTDDDEDFYRYWMDVADPRGVYLSEFEDYIMSGGGWY